MARLLVLLAFAACIDTNKSKATLTGDTLEMACIPLACGERNCGLIDDGCSGNAFCGSCPMYQNCITNKCVPGATGILGVSGVSGTSNIGPPSAASFEITGITGGQVRQGMGEITAKITGTHLSNTTVTLAVGPATFSGSVHAAQSNDTTLVFSTTISHGIATGTVNLTLNSSLGSDSLPAFVITPITVSHVSGAELGTTTAPYHTVTAALAQAGSGDTVYIADGTYGPANEAWAPAPTNSQHAANVAAGVSVVGQSTAGTVIVGSGVAGTNVGLMFAGAGAVSTLTIKDMSTAMWIDTGNVSISHVTSTNTGCWGIVAYGSSHLDVTDFHSTSTPASPCTAASLFNSATADVKSSSFSNAVFGFELRNTSSATLTGVTATTNSNAGIFVGEAGALTMFGGSASNNSAFGIRSQSTAPMNITSVLLQNNASSGLYANGEGSHNLGAMALHSVTMSGNANGIWLDDSRADTAPITPVAVNIDSSSIIGPNLQWGIYSSFPGAFTVRSSTFTNNGINGSACSGTASIGLKHENAKVDLGTDAVDGNVTMNIPCTGSNCGGIGYTGTCYGIVDDRPGSATTKTTMYGGTLRLSFSNNTTNTAVIGQTQSTCNNGTFSVGDTIAVTFANVTNVNQNCGSIGEKRVEFGP